MKKNIFWQIAVIVIMGFAFMLVLKSDHTWAQTQLRQSVEQKFEEYRRTIKDSYQVDIKNFKDNLKGGYGDGKAITAYDLEQLLAGIKVEMEHTKNTFVALELAMDGSYHSILHRVPGRSELTLLSYFSIGFILIWAAVVFMAQGGYMEALRRGLQYREISLKEARIDYADRKTVEAVLKTLDRVDEPSVFFGLNLAEKLDSKLVAARLPCGLLRHSSTEVRGRSGRRSLDQRTHFENET